MGYAEVAPESRYGERHRCWRCTEEEARWCAGALLAARERLRVARQRSVDRRRRAENALAAGQETFAQGLLDAADAHDLAARAAEGEICTLESRSRELLGVAEKLLRAALETESSDIAGCAACRRREVA
jgi:hypothetical protein